MDERRNNASRIFVGNLDASVSMEDVRNTFKRHGRIIEVIMRRNFAFVQFEKPDEAMSAIEKENGMNLKSRKMSISLAKARNNNAPNRGDEGSPFHEGKRPRLMMNERKRNHSGNGVPTRWGERRPFHNNNEQSREEQPFAESPFRRRQVSAGPSGVSSAHTRHSPPPRYQERRPSLDRRPNDVEIVCSNRSITDYAESIENRLKDMGLSTDILYPNSDFPLSKILDSISHRGVRYAMLLTPMSMDHRSVTLNVLQGVQQEHRNMPLEDALFLLRREDNAALEEDLLRRGAAMHPRGIIDILELLIQCKPLSIRQYDEMINYLAKCREESLDGPPPVRAGGNQHYDKILNILTNKDNGGRDHGGGLGDNHQQQPSGINPSLQKAIDSLIKTGPNLLNQIKQLDPVPTTGRSDNAGGSSGSSVNNVLNNYYSTLFNKNDGPREDGPSRGSSHRRRHPSGSSHHHGNSLFSAYGN